MATLLIVVTYSGLIPLLLPIFTVGLVIWYLCKKTMIIRFSVRLSFDESLNHSILSLIPFIILSHTLMSVWSHTTPGLMNDGVSIFSVPNIFLPSSLSRVFIDMPMLIHVGAVLLFILIDVILINLFLWIHNCCTYTTALSDELLDIKNVKYSEKIMNSQGLNSYRISKNPKYSRAMQIYERLINPNRLSLNMSE